MRCFNIKHPDGESLLAPVKSPHHHWAIRIDDNFFKALMSNALYTQSFSRESSNYVVRKEVLASTLWSKITHFAASSDSPVLIFGDNAVKQSVPDCYKQFASIAISPESGLYMSSYESAATAEINIDNCDGCLDEIVAKAVRILDDIIDLELERIEKIIDKIHSDKECLEQKGTEIELWKKVKEQISFGRRIAI